MTNPPIPESPDVMVDVTPTLTMARENGVWSYTSTRGQDATQVVKELHAQAQRLENRRRLYLEAAAALDKTLPPGQT